MLKLAFLILVLFSATSNQSIVKSGNNRTEFLAEEKSHGEENVISLKERLFQNKNFSSDSMSGQNGNNLRKRRSTQPSCKSVNLYVNLTTYNVTLPKGFNTAFCGDSTPIITGQGLTRTVAIAIRNTFNNWKNFPSSTLSNPACCAPTKTSSLLVLGYNPLTGAGTLKNIKNVIVKECGCPKNVNKT